MVRSDQNYEWCSTTVCLFRVYDVTLFQNIFGFPYYMSTLIQSYLYISMYCIRSKIPVLGFTTSRWNWITFCKKDCVVVILMGVSNQLVERSWCDDMMYGVRSKKICYLLHLLNRVSINSKLLTHAVVFIISKKNKAFIRSLYHSMSVVSFSLLFTSNYYTILYYTIILLIVTFIENGINKNRKSNQEPLLVNRCILWKINLKCYCICEDFCCHTLWLFRNDSPEMNG